MLTENMQNASRNRGGKPQESQHRLTRGEYLSRTGQQYTQQLTAEIISLLSPRRSSSNKGVSYLSLLAESISPIAKLVEEGILTDAEAKAIISYIASNYVQEKFDEILSDLLDFPDTEQQLKLHSLRKTLAYSRR